LAVAQARGLMENDAQRLRTTVVGAQFLNDLLCLFLPQLEGSESDQIQAKGCDSEKSYSDLTA
jgi:hypothetical protein